MHSPAFDEVHVAGLRALVRAGAEDRPGVYRMIGADGDVIYVGKSKRVRSRLLSYFRGSYPADKGARDEPGVWYGPYQGFDRVTEAVRELSDVLGLRDCANDVKMRFADQRELFPDAL